MHGLYVLALCEPAIGTDCADQGRSTHRRYDLVVFQCQCTDNNGINWAHLNRPELHRASGGRGGFNELADGAR